jgi:5-methylthioadenosine/S-adenosylhomocysteine deaminase
MSTIAVDGALVLGADEGGRGFAAATVLVEGARVAALAVRSPDRADLCARAAEVVGAAGCWLIPGLVDAHSHGYATLLRGTENGMPLELWALYTVLYGRAYDAAAIRAAVRLGAAERIRAGITGWLDHSPMVHLADAAIAAHETTGLRVAYAPFLHDLADYALMGLDLPPAVERIAGSPPPLDADIYAQRFAEFVEAAASGSGRVSVQLGPNAPQRCSLAAWTLWRCLRDRHGVAVHTHLLETRAQAALCARRWQGGLVAEMDRHGLLQGCVSVAHAVWLTRAERELLAARNVTVSHNPASNLMLGSGIMPLAEASACGLRVALGTDSANTGGRHDIFETMRLAMMLPRVGGMPYGTWPRGRDVLDMATRNGAAVLGWHDAPGRVVPGVPADLVLLRRHTALTLALGEGVDALVQHAGPEAVESVMVEGRWLMRDRHILAFDENEVIAEAAAAIAALRERTAAQLETLAEAVPAVAARLQAWQSG